MAKRKGEVTHAQIDRTYPHQVEIEVPGRGLGNSLNAMYDFCTSRKLDYRTRGHLRGGRDAARWCFRNAADADAFQEAFGGVRLTAY